MNRIAGIITRNPLNTGREVHQMLSTMSAGGSENSLLQFENFAIGALSPQIFSNASKTHFLLLDGTIYNKDEIKQKLLDAGQIVNSDIIEDLLILAYQTWRGNAFKHINGAFIITIFDKSRKKIIIARDRLGCRTLFWSKRGGNFIFASQLKGILSASSVAQSPDLNSISSYFFLGYFSQDRTPIRHINRLLPGYYIEIDQDENILINKYWTFTNLTFDTSKFKQEDVNYEIDRLLQLAVQRRKNPSNKTSCLLTGDVGSTALAKYVKKIYPQSDTAFSIGFEGQNQKLAPYVDIATNHYGYEHIKQIMKPDEMLNEIQQIVWHLDEPIADPNAVAIWNIAKNVKTRSSSIYSAIGSHEFLGSHMGQSSLSYEPLFLWFLYLSKPAFLKGLIPLAGQIDKRLALKGLRFFQRDFWSLEYIKQQALFSEKSLKKIAPQLKGLFDINLFLQQSYQYLKFILFQNFQMEDYLFFDAETTLSNRLLVQYENLFEAQGVEFFSPFLDSDFLEYTIQLPEPFKSRGQKGGLPLYNLLQSDFKEEQIANFEHRSPWFLSHWMNHPKMKDIFSLLSRGVLVEANIINGKNLRRILEKGEWKVHQFERIWSILVLEIWFNLFINNPIISYPPTESIEDFFRGQKISFKS